MTADDAIETLENDQRRNYTQKETNIFKAQGLGIAALKRVKEERTGYESYAPDLLPGETEG